MPSKPIDLAGPDAIESNAAWAMSLTNLTGWLEGESLYGWCSRLHTLGSTYKTRSLGTILFGREHACRMVDLPQGMGRFALATRGLLGTSEHILRKHTVVGAYWPFAAPTVRQQVLDSAADRLGIPISAALRPASFTRWCGSPSALLRRVLPGRRFAARRSLCDLEDSSPIAGLLVVRET